MSNSNKKYTPKTFYDIQRANVNFRGSCDRYNTITCKYY